jgi:hypothetical protein
LFAADPIRYIRGMSRKVRDVIAHAASPWYWRSDVAVWVLVASMCSLPVVALLAGLIRALTGDGPGVLVGALLAAALYAALFARPALRSLRRRRLHTSTSANA